MADATVQTPYATALPFIVGDLPAWLDEYNAQRLAAYDLYDDLFDNVPDTNTAMLRGSDDKPVFIPTAKRLINTLARYVGRGWGYAVDPALGSESDQIAMKTAFGSLFARERIISQFTTGKKEWLRRGDWIWYVQGDLNKPQGKRITVRTIDPRLYFPLSSEEDVDRLTGARMVEELIADDGKTVLVKVQRWLKPIHPDYPGYVPDAILTGLEPIYYDSIEYLEKDWDDPMKREVASELNPGELLDGITTIPLYHVRNNVNSGDPYGESELKGMESIIAAINQAVSDEDLALAIAGLGQFVTDSGAPIDPATKQSVNWQLGPASVTEVGVGRKFERLAGITSITPVQEHISYLEQSVYGTVGVNDIALGKSSDSSTISGIALALKMSPLVDNATDKNIEINAVLSNMLYDLASQWFPTYEQQTFGEAYVYSDCDGVSGFLWDREAAFTELMTLFTDHIVDTAYVHKILVEKFGYELGSAELTAALAFAKLAAAQADPYGARIDEEKAAEDELDKDTPAPAPTGVTSGVPAS